ncbi:C2 domain-containing protein Fic1 [Schizosaccharomyces japonicus yFS275]|uniref:C2 domain-containing protein Fic1 n=1 Tax=Schizosaccharomyces japonicus (strain yFS275 / FY16936) TaxID=402676 RepID=B6JV64_SCHJY|nr:C2 domain-containing protein Fic1 [Schizosaccharomyces japonicus yFS275]EEB05265.2 C2 domain-containing protein Fic1 [Schizosaccharomyces japonicus yFS275]
MAILGELVVYVQKARNLDNRQLLGKQSPYCVCRIGEVVKRTRPNHKGGQLPVWDAELRFDIKSEAYNVMKVAVCCTGFRKRVLEIGDTVISIKKALEEGEFEDWVEIQQNYRFAGQVLIKVQFEPTDPSYFAKSSSKTITTPSIVADTNFVADNEPLNNVSIIPTFSEESSTVDNESVLRGLTPSIVRNREETSYTSLSTRPMRPLPQPPAELGDEASLDFTVPALHTGLDTVIDETDIYDYGRQDKSDGLKPFPPPPHRRNLSVFDNGNEEANDMEDGDSRSFLSDYIHSPLASEPDPPRSLTQDADYFPAAFYEQGISERYGLGEPDPLRNQHQLPPTPPVHREHYMRSTGQTY